MPRHITIRAVRRPEPDLAKLAHALLLVLREQAAKAPASVNEDRRDRRR